MSGPITDPKHYLRKERDRLLKETDWRDLPSYPGSNQYAWREYRKKLRDLPEKFPNVERDENGDLININWPIPPEED